MRKLLVIAIALVVAFVLAAVVVAQTPPDTVDMKGAALGAVKFNHKAHTAGGWKCEVCHHGSKPEKPLGDNKFEACKDCHSKTATEPMKTKVAFHAVGAKTGICIDCHVSEKKGPTKCGDCHKKTA